MIAGIDRRRLAAAIARLHAAPHMAYIACTGGGAGVTGLLWSVAGCSRTLVAGDFPYDARAFAHFTGRVPPQYSSPEAAIALATAGYLRAQRCLVEQGKPATPLIGLGLTAAVATDRVRRGADRVFLAMRTAAGLATVSAVFARGQLTRDEEGEICDRLAINCLLWAAGLEQVCIPDSFVESAEVRQDGTLQPSLVSYALDGLALPVLIDEEGSFADPSRLSPGTHVIFPGSFNPLHFGHDLFAQTVAAMTGKQVVFELAAANADKPGIDQTALTARALQFCGRWPVLLAESLPLFIDKARTYGGFEFIIGLDTAVRLVDPKYASGEAARDAMLSEFRELGTRFYVCNRGDDARALRTFIENSQPAGLFVPVPMLVPISSSDLRTAML